MSGQRLVEMELVVLYGFTTFDDKVEEKKPTVQVGDPFTENIT